MPIELHIRSKLRARIATILAAVFALSSGSHIALAASGVHHGRVHHAIHRPLLNAHAGMLPRAPEYGFLSRVPPNAVVTPGYTFVPGVGILGESCDLPTSACSNQYRDVQ